MDLGSQGQTVEPESFPEQVGVEFNFDFLAVPHEVVIPIHIELLCFLDDEDGAGDGAEVSGGGGGDVGFIEHGDTGTYVNHHPSLGLLVAYHN